MKSPWIPLLFFSLVLFACTQKPSNDLPRENTLEDLPISPNPESTETIATGDNSMNSLDWNGTYTGTIPCGHCEGITVWVTLNLDQTYEFKTSYLGLNDARDEIFTGKFSWNQAGSMIQFEGLFGDYPGKFFVGENQLWYLDSEGNRYTGKDSLHYLLKKI